MNASLAANLDRCVTVVLRTTPSANDFGDPVHTWVDQPETRGYLEPIGQAVQDQEDSTGQDTARSDHLLILPPGTVIDAADRVRIDDELFEVNGHPSRFHVPRRGEHHVEVALRRVTG